VRFAEYWGTGAVSLPLADVRIIAVEQYGAGPWGTLQLADLGAEVIKIEDPASGGDVGRYVPPFQEGEDSLFFETFNRNKKSVSLDLRRDGAREVLEDLVRRSDALYSNLRGDQPAKLRLTYDDLRDVNPRIVCVSLSGFGMTGPRSTEAGYDYIMQAMAGWMSLTGDPDGPPTKSGLSLVDLSTGYVSAIALLAGLHRARRDGVGCDADVSLFETALHQLMYQGTWAATGRYVPRRMAAERIGSSTSRLRSRAAKSVKRSSASRSRRSSTSHRRSQNFGLAQATVIQPSAVWKAWKGTIDGCAESAIRRGT
jgi:crotonobetainyl-CoA:carnitine CoA-transferase CaiB-like acyl-CoA transferase